LAANGKVKESTKLFEKVAKMNLAHGDAEAAATALSVAGEINSEMGWSAIAMKESEAALKLGKNEIVLGVGAIIAARAHNLSKAQETLRVLDHDYPLATFNLGVFSPMIRTMMAVEHGSSPAEVASLMEPALPYEYGFEADMLPIYVRGESYLAVHAPEEAEREFQKILDHHSVDAVTTLYPLAELGLAQAYALNGKKDESRKAYEQYFAAEKEADKDLPILVKARQEFRALQ
jgi:tetratricopeptide (TPR) repeat protein